jgi:hypothetical protein
LLTETQERVLVAINDHLEIHQELQLGPDTPLPDLLRDLELPDAEVYQAIGDLYELQFIEGVDVAEFAYPTLVTRVTARGRQELP